MQLDDPTPPGRTSQMDALRYSDSSVVARSPEDLYDRVADVTRMGDWSPVCRACWWDGGDAARAGAWVTGQNELPERTWETRFGADAPAQIANRSEPAHRSEAAHRSEPAHRSIAATLAAIKRTAEAG